MAIRFGLIGHGFMGHVHEKTLTSLPGAQLRAICDIAPEQLADIPQGIDTYTDAAEMMKDKDIDVILIAANNNQHRKLTEMAAKAGKHVLCEKPFTINAEQAKAVLQ